MGKALIGTGSDHDRIVGGKLQRCITDCMKNRGKQRFRRAFARSVVLRAEVQDIFIPRAPDATLPTWASVWESLPPAYWCLYLRLTVSVAVSSPFKDTIMIVRGHHGR